MAFLKPYRDGSTGEIIPESYWRATDQRIVNRLHEPNQQYAEIVFEGFASPGAFAAGLKPLADARKVYYVTGQPFADIAGAPAVGETQYDANANMLEDAALSILDTDSGEPDEDGNPVMVSFFHDAIQV